MTAQRETYPVSIRTQATVAGFNCDIVINAETGTEARQELLAFAKPENIQPTHDEKGNRTVQGTAPGHADEEKAAADKAAKEQAAADKAAKDKAAAEKAAADKAAKEQAAREEGERAAREQSDRAAREQEEAAAAESQPANDSTAAAVSVDDVKGSAMELLESKGDAGAEALQAILKRVGAQTISTAEPHQLPVIKAVVDMVLDGTRVSAAFDKLDASEPETSTTSSLL